MRSGIRLIGPDLLAFVEEWGKTVERDELAECAGYVLPNGKPALRNFEEAFLEALSSAQGLPLPKRKERHINPYALPCKMKITSNNAVMITAPYIRAMGWKQGQYLHIELDTDNKRLVLTLHEDQVSAPRRGGRASAMQAELARLGIVSAQTPNEEVELKIA